jgi:chromosome segregation ATPase
VYQNKDLLARVKEFEEEQQFHDEIIAKLAEDKEELELQLETAVQKKEETENQLIDLQQQLEETRDKLQV